MTTYHGACHCGTVQFTCHFELKQPTLCNCSYCRKRNAVLHIADDVRIDKGNEALNCYRFNTQQGAHYFCRHCGIFIYSIPPKPVYPYAVNLCALDNCHWQGLALHHFDGRSI